MEESDLAEMGSRAADIPCFSLQAEYCKGQIMNMRLTEEVPMRVAKLPDYLWAEAGGLLWRRVCAGLVFAAAFACLAQDGHPAAIVAGQNNAAPQAPASPSNEAKPQADSPKDSKLQKVSPAENERKRQISDESTRLLAMAVALKAEVDKTTKDTLSLNVIRKADEIEKLAKSVKEKMKQGSGPS